MDISVFAKGFDILKLRAAGLEHRHGYLQSYNKAIEEISRESTLFFTQNASVKEDCYADKIEMFLDFDRYLKQLKKAFQAKQAMQQDILTDHSIFKIQSHNRKCMQEDGLYREASGLLR